MQEFDVQITSQRALEKYPGYNPGIIFNYRSQFISKDFTEYLKFAGLEHIRTSIAYPQGDGKIERYQRTFHEECFMKSSLVSLDDTRKQVANAFEFYNIKILHNPLYFLIL
jgi:putative transposase